MRFAALYVVFILLGQDVFAQRANTLSFYYPLTEDFDINTDIQGTTSKFFTDMKQSDGLASAKPIFTLGLCYTRSISNGFLSAQLQPFYYYDISPVKYEKVRGQTIRRSIWVFETCWTQPLRISTNQRHFINLLGGLKYRHGLDTYYVPLPVLFEFPNRKLRDIGATAGVQWKYHTKWNLVLSADVRLIQWLFIYYHHSNPSTTTYKLPRSAFEMRFGIGYCFGRKLDFTPEPAE